MNLRHKITKKAVGVGDKITVIKEGPMKGKTIEIQEIKKPNQLYKEGVIIFGRQKSTHCPGGTWQQLLPSVFGLEWV